MYSAYPRGRHLLTDSESDFSESDYSMVETTPRRKVTTRRRSISRHRWSPEHISNTYLSPPVAVIVDVHNKYDAKADAKTDAKSDAKNDARTKSATKNRKQEHKQQQNYIDPYESEDETRLRDHRRARTRPSSISREASPLPPARDYELMLDTRFLERNDARQDLELLRHQQEIARLERELARHQAQRKAAEQEELKQKLRQRQLEEIQRKMEEDEEKERIKKELRDEEARRILAEQDRARKEAAMKQAAIEEWKLNEERRMIAEREERKRPPTDHLDQGMRPSPHNPIQVHRKHLLPDTLIAYRLPWDWDELDGNYIIIKQWISEDFQEELFAHTRRLREGKLVTQHSSTLTELKVNDRKKDKMYLVRKKNPGARAWIFT
ncbi:hypothetical protein CAN33_0049000 [Aspergillus niger]|uniref:Uncharacterized protein n=1 Tax=Aspergillus niger TaxID=5061 RepID=A0A505ISJ2_ASPNG|nr:hypothetical protein CAN33_0049000 [Aspergillus niger]